MWGGAVGEVQLHAIDWWTIRERQDGATSDSDEDKGTEEEERDRKKVTKKPKGAGQNKSQGRDTEVSKSGGSRAAREKQCSWELVEIWRE